MEKVMSFPGRTFSIAPCRTLFTGILLAIALSSSLSAAERWTVEEANAWYAKQPWLVGCNFVPSTAINQLDMWNDFDREAIDRELGWAAGIGFNTVRVFLHDICWRNNKDEFFQQIDEFLDICAKHKIRPLVVIFDGVWDPDPRPGLVHQLRPGVHNSGWVQSPGRVILANDEKQGQLRPYVTDVLKKFGKDDRILGWDLFNEPDNPNGGSYGPLELKNKDEVAAKLVRRSFRWAREVGPTQPLTVGVWHDGNYDKLDKLNETQRAALESSDVISFHNYSGPESMESDIKQLSTFDRPLLCTEFMARGNGSTFEKILPVLKREKVAAYCWGLVDGKSQTKYPWPTWQTPELGEPDPWHHDIFHTDGKPYREPEVELIRKLTSE
jgi:hypothetical protein